MQSRRRKLRNSENRGHVFRRNATKLQKSCNKINVFIYTVRFVLKSKHLLIVEKKISDFGSSLSKLLFYSHYIHTTYRIQQTYWDNINIRLFNLIFDVSLSNTSEIKYLISFENGYEIKREDWNGRHICSEVVQNRHLKCSTLQLVKMILKK